MQHPFEVFAANLAQARLDRINVLFKQNLLRGIKHPRREAIATVDQQYPPRTGAETFALYEQLERQRARQCGRPQALSLTHAR